MKIQHLAPALILFAFACTYETQDNNAQLHLPIIYHAWSSQHFTLDNGTSACQVSSGYNGLTVFLSKQSWGLDVAVKSNRFMQPEATLTVAVGNDHFESYGTFFPKTMAQPLVDALSKGGKAYLEWSEFSGPSSRERNHVQNVVQLDDFGGRLKECRDSLKL